MVILLRNMLLIFCFGISDDRIELRLHGHGDGFCCYVCMSGVDMEANMD